MNIFPVGSQSMFSIGGRQGQSNPAPIIVGVLPLVLIGNVAYGITTPSNNANAQFAAVPAAGKVTLINALAGSRWALQVVKIIPSVLGSFTLIEGAANVAFGNGAANAIISPLGEITTPIMAANTGTALELQNNTAGAITYLVTIFFNYIAA